MTDVTRILTLIQQGDSVASEQLLPLVYDELRQLAAAKMNHEPKDHTLQATALVHEAYLRLVGSGQKVSWENRKHFFGAAAEAMRRVLVDAARRRARLKRGGDREREQVILVDIPELESAHDVEALNDAVDRLAAVEPEKAELVKLRFFAGLTIAQAAELLQISPATADRYWIYARAWLYREIDRERAS